MKKIIDYIKTNYNPIAIIVYGSYHDNTNTFRSDFDALVITNSGRLYHDVSCVDHVKLDVFIYPNAYFHHAFSYDEFVQLYNSSVVFDTDDIGANLKNNVIKYIDAKPYKTKEEIELDIDWCNKMLERSKTNDAEGRYRWHLLLTESLKIFCDIKHQHFFGSKKALQWMEQEHHEAFEYYEKALSNVHFIFLEEWIHYISNIPF